jgi:hypothetical protein
LIDFGKLPLSRTVRRRLAAIDQSRHSHPSSKMELANRLLDGALDGARGLYIPLGAHPYLRDRLTEDFSKLPRTIAANAGTPLCLFANPLLLPAERLGIRTLGHVKPKLRATNAGYFVVTIEHDPVNREHFEEIVEWIARDGRLKVLDSELRRYKEYQGYCVVFSGNKSLHLNFLIGTQHLTSMPFGATGHERWNDYQHQAAIMANVYGMYFDHIEKMSAHILCPPVPADRSMRLYEQFRRTPWGMRQLDKRSDILDLPKGTLVPQLVLAELIRPSRSAKGSSEYLVSPEYSVLQPCTTASPRARAAARVRSDVGPEMVEELTRLCREDWRTEYPKPTSMRIENGGWVINFRNSAADENPSTVVRGDHNQLLLQGRDCPGEQFVLPGDLTANEMGLHLGLRFGLIKPAQVEVVARTDSPPSYLDRLKRKSGRSFKEAYEERLRDNFPEYSSAPTVDLQAVYREKLRAACADSRSFRQDAVILSAEGIGKTRVFCDLLANEALDTAMEKRSGSIRFNAFAFRSDAQAKEHMKEYETNRGHRAFLWRPFWKHYEMVCETVDQKRIAKADFENETDLLSVLSWIKTEQPIVFDELERRRRSLWLDSEKQSFFNGATVLFTTHATAMTWVRSRLSRAWHHPDFEPTMTSAQLDELRQQVLLENSVIDEPEYDEFLFSITAALYRHLAGVGARDWASRARSEQRGLFGEIRRSGAIPHDLTFEDYSELRLLDLNTLEKVEVDYPGQPFGRENSSASIYRSRDGDSIYFGRKRWPFDSATAWTYLTTERFTTDSIAAVYDKEKSPLLKLELDHLPSLYPFTVPVVKDRRAKAQSVQELAQEIMESGDSAIVISDGLGELRSERALTFQTMKGHNGLSDKDVYVIVTFLAPEVYAQLNALGQWIGEPETISKYYAAQISQAIGRNTGFRQKPGTKTVVVTSKGLFRFLQPKLEAMDTRFVLQPVPDRMW